MAISQVMGVKSPCVVPYYTHKISTATEAVLAEHFRNEG